MTTGEKIAKLRRENNYTQEQFAELLGVSRQSISKYESNLAYPDTDKLIKISDLFGCTLDYLLKEQIENSNSAEQSYVEKKDTGETLFSILRKIYDFEIKSKRTIFGMPLWHIGRKAKGFIAVGLFSRGVISFGLLSVGFLSFGMLSIGILAFGLLALGLIAAACIAVGGLTFGAISVGIITFGAVSIGQFSVGALALGHYFGYGAQASGMFAFGDEGARGQIYEKIGELSAAEKEQVVELMYQEIPTYFHWIIAWFKNFL